MTIPTLVQNYQTRAWNTASTVFQRKIGEALKVMNTQQTLAGYKNTEDFVNELSKHIKITKICDNNNLRSCFSDKVIWDGEEVDMSKIKKAKNFGIEDWDTEIIGAQFANGVNGLIAYNPDCTQDPFSNNKITISENKIGTDCIAVLYDVDGFKNPNTRDKDIRNIGQIALGGSNCAIELSDGTCFTAPFIPTPLTHEECVANKSTWGIEDCPSYFDDYWGGAVKRCKGTQNMPTQAQLDQLARELYPGTTITTGAYEYSDGDRDNDKAIEMNFISSADSVFFVWSGEMLGGGSDQVYLRNFITDTTCRGASARSDDFTQAVCLAD